MTLLWLSLAGGTGALVRFVADGLIRTKLGRDFPWGTTLVNISGSLILGVIIGLMWQQDISSTTKLIIGTGFCGGYTTFSTASFETVRLIEEKRFTYAILHSLGNLCLTVIAVAFGIWFIQLV